MKSVYNLLSPEDRRSLARCRTIAIALAMSLLIGLIAGLSALAPDETTTWETARGPTEVSAEPQFSAR